MGKKKNSGKSTTANTEMQLDQSVETKIADEMAALLACEHTTITLGDDGASATCATCGAPVDPSQYESTGDDGDPGVEPFPSNAASAADIASANAANATKSWKVLQSDRVRRGLQFAQLSARVFAANALAVGYSKADSTAITARLDAMNAETEKILNDFLAKMPEAFEGIVPTKSGAPSTKTSTITPGTRVRLVAKALKRFADMFSPEDLDSLRIVRAGGGMYFCESTNGIKFAAAAAQFERIA